jgi:hypothetical protein
MSKDADRIAGDYVLVSVNDQALPVRIHDSGSVTQDLRGGTLSLTEAGEAIFSTQLQNGIGGISAPQTDGVSGTYTYLDGVVRVDLPNSPLLTITREGDSLTAQFDTLVFEYMREPS